MPVVPLPPVPALPSGDATGALADGAEVAMPATKRIKIANVDDVPKFDTSPDYKWLRLVEPLHAKDEEYPGAWLVHVLTHEALFLSADMMAVGTKATLWCDEQGWGYVDLGNTNTQYANDLLQYEVAVFTTEICHGNKQPRVRDAKLAARAILLEYDEPDDVEGWSLVDWRNDFRYGELVSTAGESRLDASLTFAAFKRPGSQQCIWWDLTSFHTAMQFSKFDKPCHWFQRSMRSWLLMMKHHELPELFVRRMVPKDWATQSRVRTLKSRPSDPSHSYAEQAKYDSRCLEFPSMCTSIFVFFLVRWAHAPAGCRMLGGFEEAVDKNAAMDIFSMLMFYIEKAWEEDDVDTLYLAFDGFSMKWPCPPHANEEHIFKLDVFDNAIKVEQLMLVLRLYGLSRTLGLRKELKTAVAGNTLLPLKRVMKIMTGHYFAVNLLYQICFQYSRPFDQGLHRQRWSESVRHVDDIKSGQLPVTVPRTLASLPLLGQYQRSRRCLKYWQGHGNYFEKKFHEQEFPVLVTCGDVGRVGGKGLWLGFQTLADGTAFWVPPKELPRLTHS